MSKQTRYCLRTISLLVDSYQKGPKLASELAREGRIPLPFLRNILAALKADGIVSGRVGPKGGYRLERPPESIMLGSVIRSIEGPLASVLCADETASQPCTGCENLATCGTRLVMRKVRDAAAGILDHTSLAKAYALGLIDGSVDAENSQRDRLPQYEGGTGQGSLRLQRRPLSSA